MKRTYVYLHLLLMLFSISGIFSKKASAAVFLSREYLFCYGAIIGILGIYAIFWQQLLKKLPLTIAMANKAVMVIWGMLYGALLFHEKITLYNLLGAVLIIAGVCIVAGEDGTETPNEERIMERKADQGVKQPVELSEECNGGNETCM